MSKPKSPRKPRKLRKSNRSPHKPRKSSKSPRKPRKSSKSPRKQRKSSKSPRKPRKSSKPHKQRKTSKSSHNSRKSPKSSSRSNIQKPKYAFEPTYLIQTENSWLSIGSHPVLSNGSLLRQCVDEIKDKLIHEPEIMIYGKVAHQKRDVGFFSDTSEGYRYSGKLAKSQPLSSGLRFLLNTVNEIFHADFNGILINYYKDGNNTIGAHSDDETCLDQVGVVSLSYGAVRTFRIRDKKTKKIVMDVPTLPNELLHMGGDFQKEFTHEIPCERKIKEERYSFTFRKHRK